MPTPTTLWLTVTEKRKDVTWIEGVCKYSHIFFKCKNNIHKTYAKKKNGNSYKKVESFILKGFPLSYQPTFEIFNKFHDSQASCSFSHDNTL